MTYPLFGRGPDGILDIGFGGMIEAYDKVCVCFWDHQRQPFLLRDIDKVTAQDVAVAAKKTRGEIGFVPVSSERSFTIEAGSPDQRRQAMDASHKLAFGSSCPAYNRLDTETRRQLRNLMVVAFEDSTGRITPFTNMLTHQWYDDDETRYAERIHDARRFHFFVTNSYDGINLRPSEIGAGHWRGGRPRRATNATR